MWDLSEIFASTSDPSIHKTLDELNRTAVKFLERYKGKIEGLSTKGLLRCIEEYESYKSKLDEVTLFANLAFSSNMTLRDAQLLRDTVTKSEAKLSKMLTFFELEIGALVSREPEIILDPGLVNYKHFLERLKREAAYRLSEVEEQLIIEKDQFGVKGWEELQSKWLNTRTFKVEIEGEKKIISFSEAGRLMTHPDRAARESASKSIFGLLGEYGEVFASALRNLCDDWLNNCERRKYDSPMHASIISNDVDQQTVENLLKAVQKHTSLYHHYLGLKAKLMKLPKLGYHDIMAPLPDAPRINFAYQEAQDLIINAYSRFDEDYASAAEDMFARNHLDVSPRFGKQNGAFCSSWYRGKSAFILSNYNERLRDVYTLAHELGHATHDYYSQPKQTILNLKSPMVVAETASIFGELLLTDFLLSEARSEKEKKSILCLVLDGAGSTIFKVTASAWFEQSLYDAINNGEYLDYGTICSCWETARDRIFGDSVEWFDELKADWTVPPHYYMANFRFYNYPYVYAQLFVYALYQKYLREGREFVPKFKEILSAGSTISPKEIGEIVGFDIADEGFWGLGMEQYMHFVRELEKLVG